MTDDPILFRFRCKNAYSEGFYAGMREGEKKGFNTAKKLYENRDYIEGYEQGYEEGKRDALAWLDDDDLMEIIKEAVIKEFKEYHGLKQKDDATQFGQCVICRREIMDDELRFTA